jgi:hypothetical protein
MESMVNSTAVFVVVVVVGTAATEIGTGIAGFFAPSGMLIYLSGTDTKVEPEPPLLLLLLLLLLLEAAEICRTAAPEELIGEFLRASCPLSLSRVEFSSRKRSNSSMCNG